MRYLVYFLIWISTFVLVGSASVALHPIFGAFVATGIAGLLTVVIEAYREHVVKLKEDKGK